MYKLIIRPVRPTVFNYRRLQSPNFTSIPINVPKPKRSALYVTNTYLHKNLKLTLKDLTKSRYSELYSHTDELVKNSSLIHTYPGY